MADGAKLINNIKKARIQNNKTQEELARTLGISLRSYQNIENNKQIPSVLTALKLAKILNVTVETLYIID